MDLLFLFFRLVLNYRPLSPWALHPITFANFYSIEGSIGIFEFLDEVVLHINSFGECIFVIDVAGAGEIFLEIQYFEVMITLLFIVLNNL